MHPFKTGPVAPICLQTFLAFTPIADTANFFCTESNLMTLRIATFFSISFFCVLITFIFDTSFLNSGRVSTVFKSLTTVFNFSVRTFFLFFKLAIALETNLIFLERAIFFHFLEARLPFLEARLPFLEARLPFLEARLPFLEARLPFLEARLPFLETLLPFLEARLPFLKTTLPVLKRVATFGELVGTSLTTSEREIFLELSLDLLNEHLHTGQLSSNWLSSSTRIS